MLQYDNSFRILLGLPRYCSASAKFCTDLYGRLFRNSQKVNWVSFNWFAFKHLKYTEDVCKTSVFLPKFSIFLLIRYIFNSVINHTVCRKLLLHTGTKLDKDRMFYYVCILGGISGQLLSIKSRIFSNFNSISMDRLLNSVSGFIGRNSLWTSTLGHVRSDHETFLKHFRFFNSSRSVAVRRKF